MSVLLALVVVVSFYADVERPDARAALSRAGVEVLERPDLLATDWLVSATEPQVAAIAAVEGVRAVFPASRELIDGKPVRACAGPGAEHGAIAEYVASIGNGWDGPGRGAASLTYSYERETAQLPPALVLGLIERALREWQKHAKLEFQRAESSGGERNLAITFGSREHGDGYEFDGKGGRIAHSFYPTFAEPIAGDVHVDDDETWTAESLYAVLLHEVGHALGIGHADSPGAVMYPYLNEYSELQPDDIAALQRIYEMVDIHTHVVPGVDDGPETLDDAVALLEAAAADGVTEMVATPHDNALWRFDAALTKRLVCELQERMGDRIRLSYGCEMHLTVSAVEDAVAHPSKYAINGYKYVLVEMSNFAVPSALEGALGELQKAGLRPILAHPERNAIVQSGVESLRPLVEAGVLMQLTANAVKGAVARRMIEAGFVHVVASDAHNLTGRKPGLSAAYREIESRYGRGMAETLFRKNPGAIVSGSEV